MQDRQLLLGVSQSHLRGPGGWAVPAACRRAVLLIEFCHRAIIRHGGLTLRQVTEMVMKSKRTFGESSSGRLWYSAWPAVGVSAAAFAVYLITLAPSLTNANYGTDGGDLISAARVLGVPHPTGYPTYTMLAWLFTQLPIGTIAHRVNLLSAVCAALAVGVFYSAARRVLPPKTPPLLVPAFTALTLAFSSLLWSQAVIAEVYALLALFAAVLLWCLVRWRDAMRDRYLWLAACTLGLALGNHLTILFWAPAALITLWPERRSWMRVKTLLPAAALLVLGLSVYAYLPLAARHGPPVNWGNPETWKGFAWVVSGKQYQRFAFGVRWPDIPGRLAAWAERLGDQFGWWGLAAALIGGWGQWRRDRRLALFSVAWMCLTAVYAFFYNTGDSHVYLLPVVMLMALWWGEGIHLLLGMARSLRPVWQRLVLVLLVLLPLGSAAMHWGAVDPDDDWELDAYIHQALDAVEPGALIIVRADRPTFALWYGVYAEGLRPDVRVVSGPLLAYIWYRDNMRLLYPDLSIPVPTGGNLTWDDLVYRLAASNTEVPTYLTDFKEEWREWFELTEVGTGPIYRVRLVESLGP